MKREQEEKQTESTSLISTSSRKGLRSLFLFSCMTFEEASDMYAMYSISPELTCTCDDLHMCQQCYEDMKNENDLNNLENQSNEC